MKRLLLAAALLCAAVTAHAQKVTNVMGAIVGNTRNTPQVQFIITFDGFVAGRVDSGIATSRTVALDSSKFALVTGSGTKVYATRVTGNTAVSPLLKITFTVTPADFEVFEGLVSSASGAYLINEADIPLTTGTYPKGTLQNDTEGKLAAISQDDWNQYILNNYSSRYLFPQELKVGTDLGGNDSNQTSYYLDLQQSRSWLPSSSSLGFFWGLEGRWSTLSNDPLNFVRFYPAVLQYDLVWSRLSFLGGAEIGSGGFAKNGRGTGMLNFQFRFPWNLVDLTFGQPRAQIHPLINISAQYSKAWSDHQLPDSLQQGLDVNGGITYNVPVLKSYLLQTNAGVNYSYQTKRWNYLYDISLGYVSDGNIRVLVSYKQGYEKVTQVFDKQLLLGFAFDALNQLTPP